MSRDSYAPTLEIEMQQMWRTGSQSNQHGYFVWEVVEVVGTPFDEKVFIKCRDGSFIMIYCYHSWILESAKVVLNAPGIPEFQILNIIE